MNNGTRVVTVLEPGDPVEELLAAHRRHLLRERGLSSATADCYERRVRRFLADRAKIDGLGLDGLTAAEVTGFLADECPRRGTGEGALLVAAMRSLLRYLNATGLIAAPLEWAVPAVANVRAARCREHWSPRWSPRCWPVVIADERSADATTRSCCCWPGWGCARARSLKLVWMTSTGVRARSWFMARAAGKTCCRYPSMSARPWRAICDVGQRDLTGAGRCS